MMYCCVPHCVTNRHERRTKVSFHQFPVDPELCEQWLRAVNRKDFVVNDKSPSSLVCFRHFKKSDYLPGLKVHRLKRKAVPSLFLDPLTNQEELFCLLLRVSMNPETNSNLQNDELCRDSKTVVNSKRANRDAMRKLQVKRSKSYVDEKMEVEDENQNVDTVVNSEKKNGVNDESKIIDNDENKNEDAKGDIKDSKCKGTKSSHIQNCVSKDLPSNGVNCEKKFEQEHNSDLPMCNNDEAKHLDDKLSSKVKEKCIVNRSDSVHTQSSPSVSEGNVEAGVAPEKQSDSDVSKEVNSVSKDKDVNENVERNNMGSPKDIRPTEKMFGMSPETIVSDVGSAPEKETAKNDSVASKSKSEKGKETNSEVSVKESGHVKTNSKGRENDTSARKEGEPSKKKKSKICEECGAKKGLKFQVHFQGKTRFLCSDACFRNFKAKQDAGKATQEPPPAKTTVVTPQPQPQPCAEKCAQCLKEMPSGQGYYPVVGETKILCSEECMKKYHEGNIGPKKCSQCKKLIEDLQNAELLTWETMLFCNEDCLGKYQSYLGSHCTCCHTPVQQSSLGKYCVCFGADIRQFCSGSCLEEFKKGLKVCSYCQTDLSASLDGFLAPVGDKGQFKDFCSQLCMERYEVMNNISKNAPPMQECSHCKKQGTFKIQVKHGNKTYSLCCDLCVAGFRCSNKIKELMCETCYKFFTLNLDDEFSLKLDGVHKHFCTKACMTLFVLSHRKIVPCVWCKVKKYNFDMIERTDSNSQAQVFCSLNCLSLYRVSLNATSSKSIRCDNCNKIHPAQYHLTMSDGSIRNFCNYQCVIVFQNQFTNVPALTTTTTTRQTSSTVPAASKTATVTSTPVISNVISLAPATRTVAPSTVNKLVPQKLVSARQPGQSVAVVTSKSLAPSSTVTSSTPPASSTASTSTVPQQVVREIVVKPPAPKSVKNKTVSCKPIMQSKAILCKPQPCHKAVQTDDSPRPVILPIPVPIYVPTPVHMFSRPVPCPVPFPVPIPVPIIVPTSKDSPSQVIKHLKDIQEKMPSNPYEAELLMMAEMVAEDNGKDQRVSKDKGQSKGKETYQEKVQEMPAQNDAQITSDTVTESRPSTSFAESSATFDHPSRAHDHASTSYDHSSKSHVEEQNADIESDAEDEYVFKDSKSHHRRHHGKRNAGSHGKSKGRKKIRSDEIPVEEEESHGVSVIEEQPGTSCQNEQPKTVSILKVARGLHAWKGWVIEKNNQMAKGSHSSRKFKLFKTDILQLPPDELNYSLCLFVKEVRKPSGDNYSSGGIYYLCLSIQKYLFENGRIDNIFTDTYYEKFTECLNDALQSHNALFAMEVGLESGHIEEDLLWQAKQLGAHSPHVLLNTLMYFNTKYFKLRTVEDHARLSFSHVTRIWERTARKGIHNALLRYYPPSFKGNELNERNIGGRPNKYVSEYIEFVRYHRDETLSYEQKENEIDPMRCPVKLFEFYVSKCPESMKSRNDSFYLYPERSCVPDSPVWYSTQTLSHGMIARMLTRIRVVEEANEN